jgi:hypothetical protein
MKQYKFITVAFLLAGLQLTPSIGRCQDTRPSLRSDNRAVIVLKEAQDLYKKKNYPASESNCRLAIDLYEQQNWTSMEAYDLLARSLYRQGHLPEAYEAASYGWRYGKNERQDLLLSVIAHQLHKGRSGEVMYSAYTSFLRTDPLRASERVGDARLLPGLETDETGSHSTPDEVFVSSMLLLAADPILDATESLEWLDDAEHARPHMALTAFLRGKAEHTLGNLTKARMDLAFAKEHGSPKLRVMAADALTKIGN